MRYNRFENYNSWSFGKKSVKEEIKKNEYVKKIRQKLMKKKLLNYKLD